VTVELDAPFKMKSRPLVIDPAGGAGK